MAKSTPPSPTTPAAYTVVARRYRPKQFSDLIGQEHVAAALRNAIGSGRIAHAYLFTGARGVGKTSCARILAKALNCEKGPTPTPCDQCGSCLRIANGEDMDAVEIDGASNNKVDEARELRNNVGFRPQHSRFKIYIIDEVHMLSTGAFNALLKTLEEPPPHVKFIFATTEAQKIPITILSRCQRFDFAGIGTAKVFETLQHIAKQEGLKADDAAIQIVARRAGGSMRDAQTLLDQLLGFCEGDLTAERVHALLGTAGEERVADLAAAIFSRDAKKALELLGEAAERGLQLGEFLDQLIEVWRGLMLILAAGEDVPGLPGTTALQEKMTELARGTTLDTVLTGLDILTTTKTKLRGSPHVQVLLEVAVVRLSRLEELLSVSQLVQAVSSGKAVALPNAAASAPARGSTPGAGPGPVASPSDPSKKNGRPTADPVKEQADPVDNSWPAVWARVLQEVGLIRAQHLKHVGIPAITAPNVLSIRFPAQYSSAYDSCAGETGQDLIRTGLRKVTGQEWRLLIEKTDEPAANGSAPPPAMRRETRQKDLLNLPLFQKAVKVLGAQLVRVEDGFDPNAVPDNHTEETDDETPVPETEDE